MKKTISAIIIFSLFFMPALGNASYLLRLKNGRQLATPAYWFEGRLIFFSIPGGTAGMERTEIASIENSEYETQDNLNTVIVSSETEKEGLPPTAPTGKLQEQPPSSKTKEKEELNDEMKAYKKTKDQMTEELNRLLEKMHEASATRDNDAKEKIREQVRTKSKEIYKFSDEVKERNKGKLPEGWWDK